MRSTKLSVLAILVLGGAILPAAMAQTASKIGVINFQRAVVETAEFKKVFSELQTKYQPRQVALQKAQQEMQDIETQLRASEGKLSASGTAELQARAQRKQTEVERLTQDIQDEFNAERDAALQLTSARMTEVLRKLAEGKGLDLILDSSAGTVPYSHDGMDVTDEAISAFNTAYPAK